MTIKNVLVDNLKEEVFDTLPNEVYVSLDFKNNINDIIGTAKPYLLQGKLYADFELKDLSKCNNLLYPCLSVIQRKDNSFRLLGISLCQNRNTDNTIPPIEIR